MSTVIQSEKDAPQPYIMTPASPQPYPTASPQPYPTASPQPYPTASPQPYPTASPQSYPMASPQTHPMVSPQPNFNPPQYTQVQVQESLAAEAALGQQHHMAMFAQCARGVHQIERKFGACGIITAIVLFPIGLICLFIDTHQKCARCGAVM